MKKWVGQVLILLIMSLSVNAQIPLTDSLIIRLQADAIPDQGLNDGDPVTEWLDLADADSVDGTVSIISGQDTPDYVASVLNGKGVVRFNNSNVLASAPFSWPDVSRGVTVLAVSTGDQSGAAGERLWGIGEARGAAGQYLSLDVSTSRLSADAGSGARFNNGKSLVSAQNPLHSGFHVTALKIGQSDYYQDVCYYVNDPVLQVFDSTVNPANRINFPVTGNTLTVGTSWINGALGTSDMFTGDLAEILVYNRELSTAEIEQMIDYLKAEYGLDADTPVIDDMVIHLDASSLKGLRDGDPVNVWPDLATGDTIDGTVTKLGANLLPTYKSDILNGKPVVRFTNAQVLSSADFSWLDVDAGLTICAVLTGDSSGQTAERAFGIGDKTGAVGKIVSFDASTTTDGADGGSGFRFNNGKALVRNENPIDNDFHTVTLQIGQGWQYQSARYSIDDMTAETFDNVANGANALNLPSGGNTLTLGTSWINGALGTSDMYSGDMAEIMVFNRLLSIEEMELLQNYLYDKYFYSLIATSPRSLSLEEGRTGTIDIQLSVAPAADVILSLEDSAEPNQLMISPHSIFFTSSNWDNAVTVQVTAKDDDWFEGPHLTDINISAQSADPQYQGVSTKVLVTIIDNECSSVNSPPEDLNLDCIVDISDIALLAESWLWCDPMRDVLCHDLR